VLIPERIRWSVTVLDVQPDDRVLEIGCGRGAALELIGESLVRGRATGLDRSAVAIASTQARIRRYIDTGKVRLIQGALSDASFDDQFDKVFAINVNLFWTNPKKELPIIRQALGPKGRLYLFYEPPSDERLAHIRELCSLHLQAGGFEVTDVRLEPLSNHVCLSMVAKPFTAQPAPPHP